MKFLLPIVLLTVGCANVSTTRFLYEDAHGSSVCIEMPKEVEATNLQVTIDAKAGTARIEASKWLSTNQATIQAQGTREMGNLREGANLVEKVSEGVSRGAVKGIIP